MFDDVADVSYTILPNVPESLHPGDLSVSATRFPTATNKITIPLPANEPENGEYSIVVQFGNDSVELIRQSEAWLQKKFDFKRPGGYTILGRRTVDTTYSFASESGRIEFVGQSSFPITPWGDSPYPSIREATGLLHYLWAQPIKQGPTSLTYANFLQRSFPEKLEAIRDGKFSVMCAGFRDLFLHAAANRSSLKVRAVAAMNYSPQIADLISYSHATTEIWIPELKRWVLFDPWYGIMVTMNGKPSGAKDIQKNYNDAHKMQIIPIIESIPRFYRMGDGSTGVNVFQPESVHMTDFRCNDIGCTPGYRDYFLRISTSEMQSLVVDSWTDFTRLD